jgi:hypothetical protein
MCARHVHAWKKIPSTFNRLWDDRRKPLHWGLLVFSAISDGTKS